MPLPPPLFAFGWANLPMLGWLAAAAAPILIHLWSRRKYREMSWAAMEYLLAAVRRQTRRLLVEQWLLLAVRTLLVVLVVLAVAEPYVERAGLAFAPGGHAHRVLVLDGSYSMAYKPTDKTRFERAKELARQIVEESPQGDAFTLVLMSSPPRVVVGTPALEPSAIVQEIDNLQLPHTTADLPATIAAIRQVVENVADARIRGSSGTRSTSSPTCSGSPGRRSCRKPPRPSSCSRPTSWPKRRRLFADRPGPAVGGEPGDHRLRAADPLMTVGRNVPLEVELKNFGRQARSRQPVELLVDGRRIEQKEVDIPPDGTASVGFSYRFDAPGDHAIEVRAAGDALDVDNHRYPGRAGAAGDPRVVHRRAAVRHVRSAAPPTTWPWRWRRRAQQADHAPGAGGSRRGKRAAGAQPGRLRLPVPLQRGPIHRQRGPRAGRLSPRRRQPGVLPRRSGAGRPLQPRVGRGGAGQGRGAAHLARPARPPWSTSRSSASIRWAIGIRSCRRFAAAAQTSLLTTPVFKYYKLALPADSSRPKTVLALANGDPLVVEQPIHRGRVVLVATSAEPSWTAMPLWPSFVPLVQEIVAWCAAGSFSSGT